MKTLSKWAKATPVKARWLIALSHVLVVLNAFFLGILLFLSDWETPPLLLSAVAGIFCLSYLLYPKKGIEKGLFRHSYARQKTHDFSLVLSSGLVIALGVNHFAGREEVPVTRQMNTRLMSLPSRTESVAANRPEIFQQLNMNPRELKKQIRHELKSLKKEFREHNKQKKGSVLGIIMFSLFTILGLLFLAYLIAGLACNLSCSGQEGLASVVLIAGGIGIALLLILAIQKISRMASDS